MRSTTFGSVMRETIFMVAPQEHSSGSASKILRNRRAQDARLSRVNSDGSLTPPADRVASRIPAQRNAELARARFDSAP